MREAVRRQVVSFTIANRGVVDRRVEATKFIDACSDLLGAGDGVEVTLHDCLGLRQSLLSIPSAGGVAGMKDDLVALACEQLARHEAEAGGRAGNEDTRHLSSP